MATKKKDNELKEELDIKEQDANQVVTQINRDSLNLQHFMDDMQLVGAQVKDRRLKKPTFNYGDLGVTNYLLWLILAELMMMNDKQGGTE